MPMQGSPGRDLAFCSMAITLERVRLPGALTFP